MAAIALHSWDADCDICTYICMLFRCKTRLYNYFLLERVDKYSLEEKIQ